MSLKNQIRFGTVLPHRSAQPLSVEEIRRTAQAAERAGFQDLWVTENTPDENYSLDPFLVLTCAAAATTRIRLGISVVVLPVHNPIHVAHSALSLDFLSNGRMTLAVGLGRPNDYHDFQVPMERRVGRFREGIELMKALWTQAQVDYQGEIYKLKDAGFRLRPVQQPHPVLWLGGTHANALKRAARMGSGWMGGGAQPAEEFARSVPLLRQALEEEGKDPGGFSISKRIFIAVDRDAKVAEAEARRWFSEVYLRPPLADAAGVWGTPEQVREQLEVYVRAGATHLLLNSVSRYEEQVRALAEVIAL